MQPRERERGNFLSLSLPRGVVRSGNFTVTQNSLIFPGRALGLPRDSVLSPFNSLDSINYTALALFLIPWLFPPLVLFFFPSHFLFADRELFFFFLFRSLAFRYCCCCFFAFSLSIRRAHHNAFWPTGNFPPKVQRSFASPRSARLICIMFRKYE